MPELPEVECTTRAIRSVLLGQRFESLQFHRADLRWPIPVAQLQSALIQQLFDSIERRSKYILCRSEGGILLIHLGMTGRVFWSDKAESPWKHTHASFKVSAPQGGPSYLHYVDPRRFGCLLFLDKTEESTHPLLADLGPEPLTCDDLGAWLWSKAQGRQIPIKSFLMDAKIVVGVGNIYASEALFRASLHPLTPAAKPSREQYQLLAQSVQKVLQEAIDAGGTSFRDFRHLDGKPGYFEVALAVYGREGEACLRCQGPIHCLKLSGRSSFFCPRCQKRKA